MVANVEVNNVVYICCTGPAAFPPHVYMLFQLRFDPLEYIDTTSSDTEATVTQLVVTARGPLPSLDELSLVCVVHGVTQAHRYPYSDAVVDARHPHLDDVQRVVVRPG